MPSLTITETVEPDGHAVSFTEGRELNGVHQNKFPCVDSSDEAQSRSIFLLMIKQAIRSLVCGFVRQNN